MADLFVICSLIRRGIVQNPGIPWPVIPTGRAGKTKRTADGSGSRRHAGFVLPPVLDGLLFWTVSTVAGDGLPGRSHQRSGRDCLRLRTGDFRLVLGLQAPNRLKQPHGTVAVQPATVEFAARLQNLNDCLVGGAQRGGAHAPSRKSAFLYGSRCNMSDISVRWIESNTRIDNINVYATTFKNLNEPFVTR